MKNDDTEVEVKKENEDEAIAEIETDERKELGITARHLQVREAIIEKNDERKKTVNDLHQKKK